MKVLATYMPSHGQPHPLPTHFYPRTRVGSPPGRRSRRGGRLASRLRWWEPGIPIPLGAAVAVPQKGCETNLRAMSDCDSDSVTLTRDSGCFSTVSSRRSSSDSSISVAVHARRAPLLLFVKCCARTCCTSVLDLHSRTCTRFRARV